MKYGFARGGLLAALMLLSATTTGLAADKVVVGVIGSLSDVPFFMAIDNGYFKDAGIEPQFENIPSLAKQVAPLSSGQLDVASGAISAGVYNAVDRGIPLKIVADKGRNAPSYGYNTIMVRKDLHDSGKVKSLKDLKGETIATIGVGSSDLSILNDAMKSVGLTFEDLKVTQLSLPNHLIAMQNKAIGFTLTPDPFATVMVEKGVAVKLATVDQFYPNAQQTVLIYGGKFINERRDVAQRFMEAYVRGVRAYESGLKGGRIAGKNAAEVIASIVKHSREKNPELLKKITPVAIDPSGRLEVASIKKDFAFLKAKGFIHGDVKVEDLIDTSFAEAADKKLGPYKP
jgi:NitT/TauT family transport system substrate-binding protein